MALARVAGGPIVTTPADQELARIVASDAWAGPVALKSIIRAALLRVYEAGVRKGQEGSQ